MPAPVRSGRLKHGGGRRALKGRVLAVTLDWLGVSRMPFVDIIRVRASFEFLSVCGWSR